MTVSVYEDEIYVTVETQQVAAVTAVGIQGISAAPTGIEGLINVNTSVKTNGSVLVYKAATSMWTSTTTLDAQNMEGGEF